MTIVWLIFVVSIILFGIGFYLAICSDMAKYSFSFKGFEITGRNIGLAVIFLGAALFVLTVKSVVQTLGSEESNGPNNSGVSIVSKEEGNVDTLSRARIVIEIPEGLRSDVYKFGCLHVRNGKDEVQDSGQLLNKKMQFEPIDRLGRIEAILHFPSNTGFQFKCFVDHPGGEFEKVKDILTSSGFQSISRGAGATNRAWFLISEYDTYVTRDGIENNFYYPE